MDVVDTLFQAAMGWTDSHLHRFQPGIGQSYMEPYFVTEFDEDESEEGTHEDGVTVGIQAIRRCDFEISDQPRHQKRCVW